MRHKALGVFVSVISHRRPATVPRMQELLGCPVTWVVGDQVDEDAYLSAGASAVVQGGRLCNSRNLALDLAFMDGLPCVELSDDLKTLAFAVDKKRVRPAAFEEVVLSMQAGCAVTGAHLAGVAPTANPFYYNPNQPLKTAAFIVGDLIYVRPCALRFDEGLRLKEDYDYTLQHLTQFGAVARVDSVLATFAHRTNKGGAVDFRTAEREQEAIAFLRAKWPGRIKDNPRRPDEILLNI